jgi:hypothetical protein
MNQHFESSVKHSAPEPLHQMLFAFGKHWFNWSGARDKHSTTPMPQVREIRVDDRYDLGETIIMEYMRESTVIQLATSLRMQGMDEESSAMLGLLESLALAGEISFRDYIGRIQNLFPRALDSLDVSLRMKVANQMIA